MRRWASFIGGAVVAGVLASCGSGNGTDTKTTTVNAGQGGVLFTLSARDGALRSVGGGKAQTLSLRVPDSQVVVFTNRPARHSGTTTIEKFVREGWNAVGMARNPPNAALVLDNAPKDSDTAIFKISDPSYSRHEHTLTYRATPVGGVRASALPQQDLHKPPTTFGPSHLFIDSANASAVRFGSVLQFSMHKDNPTLEQHKDNPTK